MHRHLCFILLVSIAAPALAGPPKEPHLDVWIRPESGQLFTGGITEGTPGEPVTTIARVFAAEMGEDPDFPFSAFEPGFQSLPGRDTAGATFAFSIPGPLLVWDGAALVASDHTMTLDFGPASVTTDGGVVEGFLFAPQPSGLMHLHFDFTLNGPVGEPSAGVYVLPIAFEGATPLYAPAPTAWIAFNFGESEATHDAVLSHAELFLACGVDLSGDGAVEAADLGLLLGAWGTEDAAADLNADGSVDATDLAQLLGAWGHVCPE